ncbi:MAG: exosortase C-terminal domain/associated protein EpsI [Candidatus Omnitrophota bacterium]|jgi:EpsI family protein
MNNKIYSIVVVILVFAALISYAAYFPTKLASQTERMISDFPLVIGEWTGEDMVLSDRVYELLETRNLIMRNYHNKKGEIINLYIVYSQDNRKVSHPPEICLQGDGAAIVDKSTLQVTDSIVANKLVIEKELSRELGVYWYKAGKVYSNNYILQQLRSSLGGMFGKRVSSALIRVLTSVEGGKDDLALTRIKEFCRLIEPLLPQYVP